jgi:hypothetical protein
MMKRTISKFKIRTIALFCMLLPACVVVFSQERFTYSQIDSLVNEINRAKNFLNILDTGYVEQGILKGRYRDSYIVDTVTNELKAIISSVTSNNTNNSSVIAYFFKQSQLIKVEIGNVRGGYHKYNLTYLYYIDEPEKEDDFQIKELQKLKYLRLAMQYAEIFKNKLLIINKKPF